MYLLRQRHRRFDDDVGGAQHRCDTARAFGNGDAVADREADVAAADATVSAGAAPTKAEFDTVVAELNETKRQLNTLIGSLRTAGVIG